MKPFEIRADSKARNTFAIPFSDNVVTKVVTSGAAESITVPAGAYIVVFSATDDFWASDSTTAAIPAADSTSEIELNPAVRSVTPGDTISVIGNCTIVAAFYG